MKIAFLSLIMLAIAITFYLLEDINEKITSYCFLAFVAASFITIPEQLTPEVIKPTELKLYWRGHLL
jgi:hypothetical protein